MKSLLLIDVGPDEYVLAMRAAKYMAENYGDEPRPFRDFICIEYGGKVTFAVWQSKTQRTVRQIRKGGTNAAD